MSALDDFSADIIEELHILLRFNPDCSQQGIKIHHQDAAANTIAAAARLHGKGLITQADGGYLTSLGHSAIEHAQALLLALQPRLH